MAESTSKYADGEQKPPPLPADVAVLGADMKFDEPDPGDTVGLDVPCEGPYDTRPYSFHDKQTTEFKFEITCVVEIPDASSPTGWFSISANSINPQFPAVNSHGTWTATFAVPPEHAGGGARANAKLWKITDPGGENETRTVVDFDEVSGFTIRGVGFITGVGVESASASAAVSVGGGPVAVVAERDLQSRVVMGTYSPALKHPVRQIVCVVERRVRVGGEDRVYAVSKTDAALVGGYWTAVVRVPPPLRRREAQDTLLVHFVDEFGRVRETCRGRLP